MVLHSFDPFDHLQMRFGEEIGITALEQQNANPALFINKRNNLARSHAGFLKVPTKLGAGFLALRVDFTSAQRDEQRLLQDRAPVQNFAQPVILRIINVQLGYA